VGTLGYGNCGSGSIGYGNSGAEKPSDHGPAGKRGRNSSIELLLWRKLGKNNFLDVLQLEIDFIIHGEKL
jgi:hypothetical protein